MPYSLLLSAAKGGQDDKVDYTETHTQPEFDLSVGLANLRDSRVSSTLVSAITACLGWPLSPITVIVSGYECRRRNRPRSVRATCQSLWTFRLQLTSTELVVLRFPELSHHRAHGHRYARQRLVELARKVHR